MRIAYLIIFLVCLISVSSVSLIYAWIPPTNAFSKIHTNTGGSVFATNYSMPLIIQGLGSITVTANNSTHTITITSSGGGGGSSTKGSYNETLSNNILINSNGFKINFLNGTGINAHVVNSNGGNQVNVTISSTNGPTLDTIQCLGTSGQCVYSGNNTNTNFQFKKDFGGQGIVVSSNSTNVIISTTFKVNNVSCTNGFFVSSFNNSTGSLSCTSVSFNSATVFKALTTSCGGTQFVQTYDNTTGKFTCVNGNAGTLTSINSQGGPAITINSGPSKNVKITTTTNTVTIDANNTAQVTNLFSPNGYGNGIQVTRTNATNNNLKSIACQYIYCTNNSTNITIGTGQSAPSPDYVITINSTSGKFLEYSGKNNTVIFTSQNSTDAGVVEQDAMNRVNSTAANTGRGGWIDTDCGTYPIQHELKLIKNGNLTMTGHGVGCTIFTISTTYTNNFMTFSGIGRQSFFNDFEHFQVYNVNRAGKTNTAFLFNSTGPGISDTTFNDLFVQNFGKDNFCFCGKPGSANGWNNRIINSILEYAGESQIWVNAGSELRVNNDKLLYNQGNNAITLNGTTNGIYMNNFFYQSQKNDIYFVNIPVENIISNNIFSTGSQAGIRQGNATIIDSGNFNAITNNIFNSPNDNYYISLNSSSNINHNLITGNQYSSTPAVSQYFFSAVKFGSFSNNLIHDNSWVDANTLRDTSDPTKQLVFLLQGMTASKTLTVRTNQTTTQGLNIPNIRETETLAIVPGTNSTTNSTAQTFSTIAAFRMQNSPIFIKPEVTGNIFVSFDNGVSDGTINGACDIKLQYGTGSAPKTGATLTGTTIGTNMTFSSATTNAKGVIPIQFPVSGLTLGTSYWIEPAIEVDGAGGTCTIRSEIEYVAER